jgi:hypothetical protein
MLLWDKSETIWRSHRSPVSAALSAGDRGRHWWVSAVRSRLGCLDEATETSLRNALRQQESARHPQDAQELGVGTSTVNASLPI